MTYDDIPVGVRSDLYFKALDIVEKNQSMPFFTSSKTKEELARELALRMYQQGKIK